LAGPELLFNLGLLALCYLYIVAIIVVTGKIKDRLPKNLSRKFLHIMIGNFIFVIPLFTFTIFPLNFPFFVAAPFILLTFLVSPASPLKAVITKMSGLANVTIGGHSYGLVFYAISYTVLAFIFSSQPYILAAGIIPLAYGDAAASLVGQKFGRHTYNVFGTKSIEGSVAMFFVCFAGLSASFLFFSNFTTLSTYPFFLSALAVAALASLLEAITPKGLDNLIVPLCSAVLFFVLLGVF
jgi:dolichol kinase